MKDERSKKLYDGITHVDDDLVEAAQTVTRRRSPWIKWAAMAACLCLIAAGAFALWKNLNPATQDPKPGQKPVETQDPKPGQKPVETQDPEALRKAMVQFLAAEAHYPEMAQYPSDEGDFKAYEAWRASLRAQQNQMEGYRDGLSGFLSGSTAQFLSGAGTGNAVYSPLNTYMALAMLAEVTDGDSRQQLLDVLGADSIESLRSKANAIWNASYRADGIVTTQLANSLWLRDDMTYKQTAADTLAKDYFASTFRGEMGSEAYNAALRAWLSQQTGGLLDNYIRDEALTPDTILALASTLYYRAGWSGEFNKDNTSADTFHALNGDITCDFMHGIMDGSVYRGDGFTAVAKYMEEGGCMWLILPDEDTDVDAVLAGGGMMSLLLDRGKNDAISQKEYRIHLSMPKFDVSSQMDLIDGLRALGVTDVFDSASADFSPITDTPDVFVGKISHAARVITDEEGVEAAAYTVISMPTSAEPGPVPEDYHFTLDRPFLFAITGTDGLPLFVGVVNQPMN